MVDLEHQFQWPYEVISHFIEDRPALEQIVQQADMTEEEISELLGYMREFISDVDQVYEQKLAAIRGGQ